MVTPKWEPCRVLVDHHGYHLVAAKDENYCINGNYGVLRGLAAHLAAHID